MCGIAGIYLRDPNMEVNMDAITSTLLEGIEHRGQHATGVVALNAEGVAEWQKAACDATTFNRYRRILPRDTRVVLAHTRWATQGLPAFMENNHPIRRGPFYIIHNGHVSNDMDLFEKAQRYPFGAVDSEAIAAHLSYEGDLSRLANVMAEIEGDAAVAAVDERDCGRLAVARGRSSPLFVYDGTKVVLFASTQEAIVKAHSKHIGTVSTKRLFSLKEGYALEWREDEEFTAEEFKVKERKWVYRSTGSVYKPKTTTGYSWDDDYPSGYAWEGSLDRQLTAKVAEADKKDDEPEVIIIDNDVRKDPDEDTVICENCGCVTFWDEAYTRWVKGENISFILCIDCVEEWDEDEWLDAITEERVQLWESEDEDDDVEIDDDGFSFRPAADEDDEDDGGIIDNYPAANESIVRSLANRILKGGSTDAV